MGKSKVAHTPVAVHTADIVKPSRALQGATLIIVLLLLALGAPPHAASEDNIQGRGVAIFARLALVATAPAGADTPMTVILALPRLGSVVMYCTTDATPTTTGGFAFQNTTAKPVVVSGFGPLQPGERTFGGEG